MATSVGCGVNWPALKLLMLEWPPLFARGVTGLAAAMILALVAFFQDSRWRLCAGGNAADAGACGRCGTWRTIGCQGTAGAGLFEWRGACVAQVDTGMRLPSRSMVGSSEALYCHLFSWKAFQETAHKRLQKRWKNKKYGARFRSETLRLRCDTRDPDYFIARSSWCTASEKIHDGQQHNCTEERHQQRRNTEVVLVNGAGTEQRRQ